MNNPTFTITDLTVDEINIILAGLQEVPVAAKISNPLTQKIRQQAEAQVQEFQKSQELAAS